jgi:hypothetical protein
VLSFAGLGTVCRFDQSCPHSQPDARNVLTATQAFPNGTSITCPPLSRFLYYNLEDETLMLLRAGSQAEYRFENDGWISRVGVNVRF